MFGAGVQRGEQGEQQVDGTIIEDHLIKSGSYAVTGTYKRSATEPSVLEITVTPLVDVEVFTNNPAITGSPAT